VEHLFDKVHKATAEQCEHEQDRVNEEYSAGEAEPRPTAVKPDAWSEVALELPTSSTSLEATLIAQSGQSCSVVLIARNPLWR